MVALSSSRRCRILVNSACSSPALAQTLDRACAAPLRTYGDLWVRSVGKPGLHVCMLCGAHIRVTAALANGHDLQLHNLLHGNARHDTQCKASNELEVREEHSQSELCLPHCHC